MHKTMAKFEEQSKMMDFKLQRLSTLSSGGGQVPVHL